MTTKPKTIYAQLKAIADANPDLLLVHRTNLTTNDKRSCMAMKPGERWLWLLREDGTHLYPLTGELDPVWFTFWISGPGGYGKLVTCLIRSEGKGHGTVERIKLEDAERLANESWKERVRKWCRENRAENHAPALINYLASGGDDGARKMLDSCDMWDIADFAGVRFPAGW